MIDPHNPETWGEELHAYRLVVTGLEEMRKGNEPEKFLQAVYQQHLYALTYLTVQDKGKEFNEFIQKMEALNSHMMEILE
jgi:hypothetical protein